MLVMHEFNRSSEINGHVFLPIQHLSIISKVSREIAAYDRIF